MVARRFALPDVIDGQRDGGATTRLPNPRKQNPKPVDGQSRSPWRMTDTKMCHFCQSPSVEAGSERLHQSYRHATLKVRKVRYELFPTLLALLRHRPSLFLLRAGALSLRRLLALLLFLHALLMHHFLRLLSPTFAGSASTSACSAGSGLSERERSDKDGQQQDR
jgi:hypothetical protein